jgi:hypothetical protein
LIIVPFFKISALLVGAFFMQRVNEMVSFKSP